MDKNKVQFAIVVLILLIFFCCVNVPLLYVMIFGVNTSVSLSAIICGSIAFFVLFYNCSKIYLYSSVKKYVSEIALAQETRERIVVLQRGYTEFINNIDLLKMRGVFNCSNSVVVGASNNPIKYLIKYCNIESNMNTVVLLDYCADYLDNLDVVVKNIILLKSEIQKKVFFIIRPLVNEKLVYKVCGLSGKGLIITYPQYIFKYTSTKGKSWTTYTINITAKVVRAVQSEISKKITKSDHIKAERNKMTDDLRAAIKMRDNYTCKICGNSVLKEPNLLLEVDHIIPVSKGGRTEANNLQTLCWRCNRYKSNNIYYIDFRNI